MTLDQQVCSLELAKKLKELGVKQESVFHWLNRPSDTWFVANWLDATAGPCSAFTVAELGEMLPAIFDIDDKAHQVVMNKGLLGNLWYVSVSDLMEDKRSSYYTQSADTEADARAKMLIYLIENKLIDPKAINQDTEKCRP